MAGTRGQRSIVFAALLSALLAPVTEAAPAAPIVRIVSPDDGAEVREGEVTLRVLVELPAGTKLDELHTEANGTAVRSRGISVDAGPVAGAGDLRAVRLTLFPGDVTVEVTARTSAGTSAPARIRLRVAAAHADAQLPRPRMHLLAIGVSHYANADWTLRYPAQDARDLAAAFRTQEGQLYRSVEARVLTDRSATKPEILDGLDWLQRQTTARDVAVLFLAGHGIRDSATGLYYFMPHEADLSAVKKTMISQRDLLDTLHSLAGKVIVFLDTCYAGALWRIAQRSPDQLQRLVWELAAAENGIVVFASSSSGQPSQESPDWGNGAFTKALVEGLRGRALYPGAGRVTISTLQFYVSERVKELTGGTQTPTTAIPESVPDFPIAVPIAGAAKPTPAKPLVAQSHPADAKARSPASSFPLVVGARYAVGGKAAAAIPGPGPAHAIAVGDFDRDGKADLAVTLPGRGEVAVLLGNGDGTFAPASAYPAGSEPRSLAVGDYNGDGIPDVATLDASVLSFSSFGTILYGSGDGTFQRARTWLTGETPRALVAADTSGDGVSDVLVLRSGHGLDVHLGRRDGALWRSAIQPAADANAIAAGDFNRDGKPDVAIASFGIPDARAGHRPSASVFALLGNGDGTFRTGPRAAAGAEPPTSIVSGDLNADGIADLAIAAGHSVAVLLGGGDGAFRPGVTTAAGRGALFLARGDFNGDHAADIATISLDDAQGISVLLAAGDGSLQPPHPLLAGQRLGGIAAGDLNGDGADDLAVTDAATGEVTVLLGTPR